MIGLIKALGFVKTALAVTAISTATLFTAQVAAPAAASLVSVQAGASASIAAAHANAGPAATPDGSGQDVAAIEAQLAANKARLVDTLQNVLAELQANPDVNAHALSAVQAALDRVQNGDTGLNAAAAVASVHPSATDHPSASDHPDASSHPGRP